MQPQMKRLQYLGIAKCLEEALQDSWDAFDEIRDAYIIANQNFEGKENDVDPATIVLGLQAQALGILTLCQWLEAISEVTNYRFYQMAEDKATLVRRTMQGLGLVIPDHVVL